ncbi:MAG: BamA/TamA family outer membrane protein [Candidatus Eremiobacteraeota bacterium]|nr:BamA/TamA family outer membrane protein [Candidatus Eremiobacteraeota bacterium]
MLALITISALVLPTASVAASGPRIVSVDISGNVHVPADRILAVIKARPGDSFDPAVVQEDLKNIFALGYFADQVPPLVRQRPGGVAITYRVIENPVITRITFAGNEHVTSDTLLALMDTSVGQVLNTNTFHQDVLKINSYYDRQGFGGQVPSHVKDINSDSLKSGVLALSIQEGLIVRRVVIVGDPLLPPTVILPVLKVKAGTPYSDEARDKDIEAVKKLYEKYDLILGDFAGGPDPSTIDLKAGTTDVRYEISAARIGAVQITGNTRTHDEVVRRELRMRPGMYITTGGLRRDYERLNSTGFFSKVDPHVNPGPDPKKPALVTIDWAVTEQRTGNATVGAGYSGGLTGQGLYGTISFSNTNLNGTGNGANIQLERGARNYTTSLSFTVPYVGKTKQSQKYSFGATVFGNGQTNYYPVYPTTTGGFAAPTATAGGAPVAVTLFPSQNSSQISGVIATSIAKSVGLSAQVGRRLTDYTRVSLGASVQKVTNQTTVPSPYFFQAGTPNVLVGPTPNPILGGTPTNGSFGINAPSIANVNTGKPYRLNSVSGGISTDTRDDIFNPHRGHSASLGTEVSAPGIGSDFNYSKTTFDAVNFFPLKNTATLGMHAQVGISTGAIPPNTLFTFSDQNLRGYSSVFYGTDTFLGQLELRKPILNNKLVLAAFIDEGAWRIRGASPLLDPYTNRIISYPGNWSARGDAGLGLRFDLPQLNLRSIRIDFARGSNGTHTSFGIGQSF